MSDNSVPKYQYLPLICCNEADKLFKLNIPNGVIDIIGKFLKKLKILGCGENKYDQYGATKSTYNRDKWNRLTDLETLLPHPDNLFINYESLFVSSANDELYYAGWNYYSISGIQNKTYDWEQITNSSKFTKIPSLNKQNMIVSKGISESEHVYIYQKDDHNLIPIIPMIYWRLNKDMAIPVFWDKNQYKLKEINCSGSSSYFLFENGDLSVWNMHRYGNKPRILHRNIKAMAIGGYLTVFLTKDDNVFIGSCGFGDIFVKKVNQYFKSNPSMYEAVSCGFSHGVVLAKGGNVLTFGSELGGKLGNGITGRLSVSEPYAVKISDDESIVSIACGESHTVVLTDRNNVYSWGLNRYCQCSVLLGYGPVVRPYLMDKENEIGIGKEEYIAKVLASKNGTIIIVDPTIRLN